MRSHWIRVGLKFNGCYLYTEKEKYGDTQEECPVCYLHHCLLRQRYSEERKTLANQGTQKTASKHQKLDKARKNSP